MIPISTYRRFIILLLFLIHNSIELEGISLSYEEEYEVNISDDEKEKDQKNCSCWEKTYNANNLICKNVDMDSKLRFAWEWMNCVLEGTGRKRYICKSKSIKLCTSKLPDSIMHVYTQYLHYIDDRCFYSDSTKWRNDQLDLSHSVLKSNENIANDLKESLDLQFEVKESQQTLLSEQQRMFKLSERLYSVLNSTQLKLDSLLDEVQKSIESSKQEFGEILSFLQKMMIWLDDRFSDLGSLHKVVLKLFGTTTYWVKTVLYAILIYIVTAIPIFSVARVPLFTALVLTNFIRLGLRWLLDSLVSEDVLKLIETICITLTLLISLSSVFHRIISIRKSEKDKDAMLRDIYEATVRNGSFSHEEMGVENRRIKSRIILNE